MEKGVAWDSVIWSSLHSQYLFGASSLTALELYI